LLRWLPRTECGRVRTANPRHLIKPFIDPSTPGFSSLTDGWSRKDFFSFSVKFDRFKLSEGLKMSLYLLHSMSSLVSSLGKKQLDMNENNMIVWYTAFTCISKQLQSTAHTTLVSNTLSYTIHTYSYIPYYPPWLILKNLAGTHLKIKPGKEIVHTFIHS
jgi:hypothetical protein